MYLQCRGDLSDRAGPIVFADGRTARGGTAVRPRACGRWARRTDGTRARRAVRRAGRCRARLGALRAVVAGLAGIPTASCDAALLARCTSDADHDGAIALAGRHRIDFQPARDIVFRVDQALAYDGNALGFTAFDAAGEPIFSQVYFSPAAHGRRDARRACGSRGPAPYPFATADEMFAAGREYGAVHRRSRARRTNVSCKAPRRCATRSFALPMRCARRSSVAWPSTARCRAAGSGARRTPMRCARRRLRPRNGARCSRRRSPRKTPRGAASSPRRATVPPGPSQALLTHYREGRPLNVEEHSLEFCSPRPPSTVLRASGLVQAGCQSEVGGGGHGRGRVRCGDGRQQCASAERSRTRARTAPRPRLRPRGREDPAAVHGHRTPRPPAR